MVNLTEKLLNILQELKEDEFKHFKWFLEPGRLLEGSSGIPVAQLEKADCLDTVTIMVQKYQDHGALTVTLKILEKIIRNDLVQRLEESCSLLKDLETQPGDQTEHKRGKATLRWAQQFAEQVDTAHPHPMLSEYGKYVRHGVARNLPYSPQRFKRCVNVLREQSFSSGSHYFEVRVKGKTVWMVGVATESIGRRGDVTLSPEDGFWFMMLWNGEYEANDNPSVPLSLNQHPQTVGVFVDYEEGVISFYDVDTEDHLHSFTGCTFTEGLSPFFSPCTNDRGRNSAPMTIRPDNYV